MPTSFPIMLIVVYWVALVCGVTSSVGQPNYVDLVLDIAETGMCGLDYYD